MFLTTESLAKRWGFHIGTLESWRKKKKGPKFIRLGNKIRYRIEDVLAYESKNIGKQK